MKSWVFCAVFSATAFAAEVSRSTLMEPLEELRRKADAGNTEAQWFLHLRYALGTEGSVDMPLSLAWLRKAAEGGYERAQRDLGTMYLNGDRVPKDITEAAKWLRKAAEQGYVQAQFDLGLLLSRVDLPQKDLAESAKLYRKAANQGHAAAQYHLAQMYVMGDGVPKDHVQAHLWLNLAGASGLDEAKAVLTEFEKVMSPEQKAEAMKLARDKWAELEAKNR